MRALITIIVAILFSNYCISVKTGESSANMIEEFSEDGATELMDDEDDMKAAEDVILTIGFCYAFVHVIQSGLVMKMII